MHFVLQFLHIIVFSLLLAVPRYRAASFFLIISAAIYISNASNIAAWNEADLITTYTFSLAVDTSIALLLSQYGGKEGCKQSVVLILFALAHLARAIEHHMTSVFVFNIYEQTTFYLHLLQLGVAYDGIIELWRDNKPRGLRNRVGITNASIYYQQLSQKP
jgi:hypothetical protein